MRKATEPASPSTANGFKSAYIGIVLSGAYDYPLGDQTPTVDAPVITQVAATDALPGGSETATATVTGTYDVIEWEIHDANGNVVPSGGDVVTYTAGTDADKDKLNITWGASANGKYTVCGIARNTQETPALASAQTCSPEVTVEPTYNLVISADKTPCAGETVVLTVNDAGGASLANLTNKQWKKKSSGASAYTDISGATALIYTQANAQTADYTFTATTSAGTPLSANFTLTVKSLPMPGDMKAYLAGTNEENTYYAGDDFTFRTTGKPTAGDSWTWAWTYKINDGVAQASSNTADSCLVTMPSSTSYTAIAKVTNAQGCQSAEVSKRITAFTDGCVPSLTVKDYFTKQVATSIEVCDGGGLVMIEATLKVCPVSQSATWMALEKLVEGTWTEMASGNPVSTNTAVYTINDSDLTGENTSFRVKAKNSRGEFVSDPFTVTKSGNLIEAVKAWTPIDIKINSQAQLGATAPSDDVSDGEVSYYWMPQNLIEGGNANAQFPKTTMLSSDQTFTVYAKHDGGCVSKSDAQVRIKSNALSVTIDVSSPICLNAYGMMKAVVKVGDAVMPPENYEYAWGSTMFSSGSLTNSTLKVYAKEQFVGTDKKITQTLHVYDRNNDLSGTAVAQVNVSDIYKPGLALTADCSGDICDGARITVTQQPVDVDKHQAVASYDWYVRDNTPGSATYGITTKTHTTVNWLDMTKRGNFTVWLATETLPAGTGCKSDTTNFRVEKTVKGFDLALTPSPANEQYAYGDQISATAVATKPEVSGWTGPVAFTWAPNTAGVESTLTTTSSRTVDGADGDLYKFKVSAVADGCTKADSVTLKVNTADESGLILAVNDTAKLCNQGAGVAVADFRGGTQPYTVSWYKAGAEGTILQTTSYAAESKDPFFITSAGDGDKYVVMVTDSKNPARKRRDTVTVKRVTNETAPIISAGVDRKIGMGSQTYLLGTVTSGTVSQWRWFDDQKLVADKTSANPRTSVLSERTTYVAYASTESGCTSDKDDVIIDVTDSPYNLAVDMNEPALLCQGTEVPLSATVTPEGTTVNAWSWSVANGSLTGATTASPVWKLNSVPAGVTKSKVIVMVTDAQGVSAVDIADEVQVSRKVAPELEVSGFKGTLDNASFCANNTISPLRVSEVNGQDLSNIQWIINGEVVCTSDQYIPTSAVTIPSLLVTAQATDGGCPAKNVVELALIVNPQPDIQWAEGSYGNKADLGANDVAMTAELKPTNETTGPYTFEWDHSPVKGGATYTETLAADTKSSNSHLDVAVADASAPYYFTVSATDAKGCRSKEISHTVVVNGNSLYVEIASKFGNYCTNGGAVLVANVVGEDEPFEYVWYERTQGSTDDNDWSVLSGTTKELMVSNPSTMEYKVVVTKGEKSGSAVTTLTAGTATASTLAGVEQTIPTGTKTALVAKHTVPMKEWHWSPENKLADGESTLPSPYTIPLTASRTRYTVYAVDENSCVTPQATVNVNTIDVSVPTDDPQPDPQLAVKATPNPETICLRNEIGIHASLWSNVSTSGTTFEWVGDSISLIVPTNTADVVFNGSNRNIPVGDYVYTVIATGRLGLVAADRVVIHVVNSTTPTLTEASGNSYCVGSVVKTTVAPASAGITYTWILNGALQAGVTGPEFTWPAEASGQTMKLKVFAQTAEGCRTDTTTIEQPVSAGETLDGLVASDSCGYVRLYAVNKSEAHVAWTLQDLTGLSQSYGKNGLAEDTCYIRPTAALTAASKSFTVDVVVTPKGGGCTAEGSYTGNIYRLPVAKIDDWTHDGTKYPYVMVEKTKDSETVWPNGDLGNTAANSTNTWTAKDLTIFASASNAYVQNATSDGMIYLEVKNSEDATCAAKDSMPVYLYPSKPDLEIDTINGSFVNAVLKMKGATNYTVYSRKWDPYCLTTRFTGDLTYNAEPTATNLSSASMNAIKRWEEPNMDTLEFYYAVAARTINYAGRNDVWNSPETSDTVGYYLFDLNVNHTASSSFNYMAVYFDFGAMNVPTSLELCKRIYAYNSSQTRIQVYSHNYPTQGTNLNTFVGKTQKVQGEVISMSVPSLIVVPMADSKFMQYGYLPSVRHTILSDNDVAVGNINWIYFLPSRNRLLEVEDLFSNDFSVVKQMYRWNFGIQSTDLTSKMTSKGKLTGLKDPLVPLQVIGSVLRTTGTSFNWE